MATINKDFKIKNGLVVEGSNATVNGNQILTETASDQYIIDLIGGETLITSVDSTDFKVSNGELKIDSAVSTLARTGDITTAIDNLDTDDIEEGTTNKYFTENRVIDVLTGSTQTNISITNVGGDLHIAAENGVDDSTTDDLDEGTTNKYFTDARAKYVVENSRGQGLAWNGDTEKLDVNTIPAGGSTADSGLIVYPGTGPNAVSFVSIDRTYVDGWYDSNGAAGEVASDLSTHENLTSGVHGVTGSVVGTTDTQDISNKKIIDTLYFSDGVTISEEGEIAVRAGSHDFDVQANQGDLNLKTVATSGGVGSNVNISSTYGDILLEPNGTAYYGSASAGNEIATHGYVDNAISGLDWKNAVHVKIDTNINNLSAAAGTYDGHTLTTADAGLRVLLVGQTTDSQNGIYVISDVAGDVVLTRSADADAYTELLGAAVYVAEGTQYGGTSWVQSNAYLTDFTAQNWTQFSGQGSVTAGDGITVDGLEVSVDRSTVDTWYEASGAVSTHSDLTTGVHGVTGNVVGTTDSQTLTSKTLGDTTYVKDTLNDLNVGTIGFNSSNLAIHGNNSLLLSGGAGDVVLSTGMGDVYVGTASSGNEVATQSDISSTIDALTTKDIAEDQDYLYYTDQRVKDVLTASTQTNISITAVAGELIITAENGVDDSTTDDLEEGINNHYFTESRAKIAAADLLVNHSTKNNITITGDETGLTITAENGVADSDTDDLTEGTSNLYFTDARAQDAVDGTTRSFTAININDYRKEEATQQVVASASTVTAHTFSGNKSVKYLVRTVGEVAGTLHSQITELLVTVDGGNNVAVTEYGTIYTSENPLATATMDYSGGEYRLRVTTAISGAEVVAAATIMSWAD